MSRAFFNNTQQLLEEISEVKMDSAFRCLSTRLLLVFLCLALSAGAFAQGGTGELSGLVTDSSGAVVPGAEVKLTNSATGETRTAISTSAGGYVFSALPVVGNYALVVSLKGFKSLRVQNIIISVGTITTRDLKLEVGGASEQVTVEAGQQIVQTEDSSLSQLVDRRVWENMPLEARNANDFINLVAGAVPEQQAGGTFRGAAVNGTRTGTGNFMVEGLDNNEQGQGGVAICGAPCGQGGSNTSVSPEAIEEYRVITHDFSAEYGKAGGFVTDMVLKSGTNLWHGSLFEYNRIQALTANDWFSNAAGVKDHLVRNQFGGSAGGPIMKDKTFFYSSFEAHRLRQSSPVTGPSMTQQFYNWVNSGQMATYVNSIAPCSTHGGCAIPTTVGPLFQQMLTKWPLALPLVNNSSPCAGANLANCASFDAYGLNGAGLLGTYPVPIYGIATEQNVAPVDQYRFSVKVDHTLGASDRLNGAYLFENVHATSNFSGASATNFGVPLDNPNRAQTAGITWTHTLSPTALNAFKIGYVRRTANFFGPGSLNFPAVFTADPIVGGFGASPGIPQLFTENLFQYKDDVSITRGKHQLKFGAEYRRTRNGSSFSNDQFGTFSNWGAEDLITDGVFTDAIDKAVTGGTTSGYGGWYYASASVVPSTGKVPDYYRGYRANEVAFYGQDDWRVNSRLTANLGLRWEYFGPPHNFRPNIDSNLYFGEGVLPLACPGASSGTCNPFFPQNNQWYAFEATANFQVRNTSLWNKDLTNFGPRVGFAWDVLGTQKIVVRTGFGIFYDRMFNNIFENIRFNPPYFADEVAGPTRSGFPVGPLKQPGLMTLPFGPANNALFVSPSVFPAGLPKPVPRHMDQNMMSPYYMQESFGLQYQAAKDVVFEASYVGTLGRKLLGILNRNTFDGRLACPTASAPFAAGTPCFNAGFPNGLTTTRPNTLFGSDNARGNYYGSSYNALDLMLRKRFSRGLSLNANYTYSKSLDQISDVFRTRNSGTISSTDVENLRNDYGPSDFDVRHRVVVSFTYDLPVFHGNRWLGGWTVNSIVSWNTGSPIGLIDPNHDANADGLRSDRPEFEGPGSILGAIHARKFIPSGSTTAVYQYFDPTQFGASTDCLTNPKINTHGGLWCNPNTGRGALPGPMYANVDFGISKTFKINERAAFRFDANFFDLLNHPNFENPGASAGGGFGGGGNALGSSNFGQSSETYGDSGGHRITQLAIRFDF
jgi:hypothetical protein